MNDGEAPAAGGWSRPSLRTVILVVATVVAAWGALGVPARATYGARTTADEPQYLLTAISLAEDRSLDISDELAEERWRDFHENLLPTQTEPFADGSELSPHDPLFPVLLAVPVAVGGASGAKVFLAALGGVLAGLMVWVAVRRFGVRPLVAGVVVAAFGLSPPLAAYATQVYPELPAALAVTLAVAALTGRLRRGGVALAVVMIVALPWLGVKYAPVALALAVVLAWRLAGPGAREIAPEPSGVVGGSGPPDAVLGTEVPGSFGHGYQERSRIDVDGGPPAGDLRLVVRRLAAPAVALAAAGIAYLALHRVWYGGWTVYAAGDHFVGGELDVVGTDADYLGRSQRLIGLLVDRDYGLAAWGPVILVAVAALAAMARRRPDGWGVLALPLLAGWLNATFVALTMHGVWWPGRQVVVIIPCAVLATAWWVDRMGRRALIAVAVLGVAGMALWATLLWQEAFAGWALIIDVGRWANPVVGAWRRTLPDNRDDGDGPAVLQLAWAVVLVGLALWAWRSAPPDRGEPVGTTGRGSVQSPVRRGVEQSGSSSGS